MKSLIAKTVLVGGLLPLALLAAFILASIPDAAPASASECPPNMLKVEVSPTNLQMAKVDRNADGWVCANSPGSPSMIKFLIWVDNNVPPRAVRVPQAACPDGFQVASVVLLDSDQNGDGLGCASATVTPDGGPGVILTDNVEP